MDVFIDFVSIILLHECFIKQPCKSHSFLKVHKIIWIIRVEVDVLKSSMAIL